VLGVLETVLDDFSLALLEASIASSPTNRIEVMVAFISEEFAHGSEQPHLE
jgi:hypothetical protein